LDICCPTKIKPEKTPLICSDVVVSLTNEQIEEQMIQFAEALNKMSELTATAIEARDEQIKELRERIEKLEKSGE
jgi:ABC-type Fe3+-hydroxamate transport system substrate-binding protein